jgi:hypothetical protein
MNSCDRFDQCGAPLCPLDEHLNKRCWYSDESVCQSRKHGNRSWVKKQKSIVQRQTKSWLNRPVMFQDLYDASRPRKISEAQKKRLVDMGLEHHFGKGD